MARNVNRETTYQWKCDICGKEDLCLYSNGKDNPHAPEGWTWLLGFPHDQEPRLELSYKTYGPGHMKAIPLSDKVEKVEPLLVCHLCTKNLKSFVVKGVETSEPPPMTAPTAVHPPDTRPSKLWGAIRVALMFAGTYILFHKIFSIISERVK